MSRISFLLRACRSWSASCIFLSLFPDKFLPGRIIKSVGNGEDVLVAPAGLIDDNGLVAAQLSRFFKGLDKGMAGFQCRDDPFLFDRETQRPHDLLVGGRGKANPP